MLQIDMDSKYGILFIRLFGELTSATYQKLENEVATLLVKIGVKNAVFNLDNIKYIDNMGYQALHKCLKICQKNKGNGMVCANQNKFEYYLKPYKVVTDELSAVSLINS